MNENDHWKNRVLIVGAVGGALVGLGTAYLLLRTAEESGGRLPPVKTGDAIRAVLGIIGTMRGVASLGRQS